MKNKLIVVSMEFRYLIRQKFLWILLLLGIVFTIWRMPRFVCDYLEYDVFEQYNVTHSFENMSEVEKLNVDYWNTKKSDVENQRKSLSERAAIEKERLNGQERFEREYLTKIEASYGKPVSLEVQDYSGWEIFFLYHAGMSPHNLLSLLEIIMTASAGLLLLTKDKENNTLFWASDTGKGAEFSSYLFKIMTAFCYGLFIQFIFHGLHILWLWLVNRMDMRHWFHMIQNIPQFGMCSLNLTIIETILTDAVIKSMLSLVLFLFVFLFAMILRKYLFMFLGVAGVSGVLYYVLYSLCKGKNYGIWFRLNLFSVFQLDKVLTYDAVNIFNHAIDLRVVTGVFYGGLLLLQIAGSYQVWRKYLNVCSS